MTNIMDLPDILFHRQVRRHGSEWYEVGGPNGSYSIEGPTAPDTDWTAVPEMGTSDDAERDTTRWSDPAIAVGYALMKVGPAEPDMWTRREPFVAPAADAGGDAQQSEAFDARFCRPLAGTYWACITRYAYVARDPNKDDGDLYIEIQTEYLICTDLEDLGGTERWSDSRYHRLCAYDGPLDDDAMTQAALRAAQAADWPTDDEWLEVRPILDHLI